MNVGGTQLVEDEIEQRLERTAQLGRRLTQRAAQRGRRLDVAADRLARQAGDEVDAARGHGLGHGAHLVGSKLEIHAS